MEIKQMIALLERIQNGYPEYPPFRILMAGSFIDRLEINLIIPFLAIYVAQRFDAQFTPLATGAIMDGLDPPRVGYGCSIICSISMAGSYALHVRTRDPLTAKPDTNLSAAR